MRSHASNEKDWCTTQRIPQCTTQGIPQCTTQRIPQCTTQRIPQCTTQRIPQNSHIYFRTYGKSNFTILHVPPPTSFTAFLALNVANFTSVKRADVYLTDLLNNDVDKPVARHFNAANHSISDINVCAISPISGGNDSHKRHEKRLIFKIGTIHPRGLN